MGFCCDLCNYETHDKSNYNRHLKSKAHIQLTQINIFKVNRVNQFICPFCKNEFSCGPDK